MIYDTYQCILYAEMILAFVFLILSIVLFFVFRIPATIGVLSGRTERKAVEEIQSKMCSGVFTVSSDGQKCRIGVKGKKKTDCKILAMKGESYIIPKLKIGKWSHATESDQTLLLEHPRENNTSILNEIIMSHIQGVSLRQMLEDNGVLPQNKVIKWGKQLCYILGYLHSQNPPVIYRNLTPNYIVLKSDGNLALTDLGDTTWIGTPGYAAPEQYGGQTDARTDIFGLGATMYHLLTGHSPNHDLTMVPIRTINESLSATLEQIILKCTQLDPKQRYQSAAELLYALENSSDDIIVRNRRLKRKMLCFFYSVLMTFLCVVIAVWIYRCAENKNMDNYDFSQTMNVHDSCDKMKYNRIADQSCRITTVPLPDSVKNLQLSMDKTKTKFNSIKIQLKEDA